jgi:hypothetical protein
VAEEGEESEEAVEPAPDAAAGPAGFATDDCELSERERELKAAQVAKFKAERRQHYNEFQHMQVPRSSHAHSHSNSAFRCPPISH